MYIDIEIYKGKDNGKENITYKIIDYKKIIEKTDMILVKESEMGVKDSITNPNCNFLEFYKIQFIAQCKVDKGDDLLVAFYLDEYSTLAPYVISGLKECYYQEGDTFRIVDYKSYFEICQLTGEKPMNFANYVFNIKSQIIGINSILDYNKRLLNFNEQSEIWKNIGK